MPPWTGSFGNSGSPILKIAVSGPFSKGKEFEAVLDTGFTGFLSMPLIEAFPLGLVLYGTAGVLLADGRQQFKLTAKGMITVGSEQKVGIVILEPGSSELLLGMAFLRQFERVLYVSRNEVVLINEAELQKAIGKIAPTTPPGPPGPPQPPLAPKSN